MSNLRKEFDSKIRKAYLNENNICECEKCGKRKSKSSLDVHHIIPLGDGGTNEFDNLIALFKRCHDEWHSVEGIKCLSFKEWLNIPPYYALVYTLKLLDKQGHDNEITYKWFKEFLRMGHDMYKISQKIEEK